MATRATAMTIAYIAWDNTNNVPKTGDAANHTLRWVKDGTASAPTNAPAEVDATNAPGVYKLALTATETDCNIGVLAGRSSTSGVTIIPTKVEFERLPDAAPGASGGIARVSDVPTASAIASAVWAATTRTLSSFGTLVSDIWAYATRSLTDKTGFSLTADYDAAKTAASQTSVDTLSGRLTDVRAAKLDNLDAAVSSRLAAADYTAPANADISAIKAKTDQLAFSGTDVKATLDGETVTVSTNQDKTGYSLTTDYDAAKSAASQASVDALSSAVSAVDGVVDGIDARLTADRAAKLDNLDAAVSSRLAASSYVAPDNTTIASIDGKVDAISDVLGAQGSAGVVAITQDTLDVEGTPLGYVRVNGVPYAGALVELLADGAARRWTVTDGDGGFSIAAERGAVYQVRVTVPGAEPSVKTVEVE